MQKVICTIRRKLVLSILLIALAAIGVFVFAACSDEITEETYRQRGYTVAVTYDYQGGTVNNKDSIRILVKENSPLPTPTIGNNVGIPAKEGYSFKGFYVAETDADGNLVRDEDGNISVTDREWNFKTDRVEDKNVTLCAKWWDNYKLVLNYGDDFKLKKVVDLPRNVDGSPVGVYESSLLVNDFTFLSYNLIKDSTDAATAVEKFPYDFSSVAPKDDGLEINVWGKSLNGNYVLVRSAYDLSISVVGETTNYYLLNDIDMDNAKYDDETASNKLPKSYRGKFIGNGHTISNFTLEMKTLDRSYSSFGLFRTIETGAEITDISFSNIKLSYSVSDASIGSYNMGMLAGQIDDGAVVKNVNISNSTLEYLVGIGVDKTKLNIAEDLLVAQKTESVKLQDCSATDIKRITSVGVVTDDEEYMLYVKYEEGTDEIVLGEDAIYDLAQKSLEGGYSSRTILSTEFVGDNKFVLTRLDDSVYDITFTVKNGELSATMVKR